MLTKIITATLCGVEGYPVVVETDVHRGMPGLNIVGLADTTIREASKRIRPAIQNSGFKFPNERVTVNLVPADRPKEGSHFDMPIALGIMNTGLEPLHCQDTAYFGEVSLDGKINPVRGMLPLVIALRNTGVKNVVVPWENAEEAAIVEDLRILPVKYLKEVVDYMCGMADIEPYVRKGINSPQVKLLDFNQVIGQESAKRAITIGIAGGHGILMIGGPGCGKTMMAKRIPTILPALTYEEKVEITGIYSVAGLLSSDRPVIDERPFRCPHHSITKMGLIGGGARPRPGELSLAHRGVLFLDEVAEFESKTIDYLRQPVEEGLIRIRRNLEEMVFPAQATIVMAANPCKCGHFGSERQMCTCTQAQLNSYRRKLNGPFADRIDMHIRVNPVDRKRIKELEAEREWMSSDEMRKKVEYARKIQEERYQMTPYRYNGDLDEAGIKKFCRLDGDCLQLLLDAYEKYGLTMRAYKKIIKLSRTIADMEGCDKIQSQHVAEALMYRSIIGNEE